MGGIFEEEVQEQEGLIWNEGSSWGILKRERRGLTRYFTAVAEVWISSKAIREAYPYCRGAQTRHIPRTKWKNGSHERHRKEVPTQRRYGILGGPGGTKQGGGGEGITHCQIEKIAKLPISELILRHCTTDKKPIFLLVTKKYNLAVY